MIKVKLEFGILNGNSKRILEEYVDSSIFKQRKTYDEYYILSEYVELNLDLELLMILSENFVVEIQPSYIIISN